MFDNLPAACRECIAVGLARPGECFFYFDEAAPPLLSSAKAG
jgi:hypothetical protein